MNSGIRGSAAVSIVRRRPKKMLKRHQLICSMRKQGDCYDNGLESCHHSLKVEAIDGERFLTRADAKQQVFDYIEVYYNRKRLLSKLAYMSAEVFELKKFPLVMWL